MRGNDDVETFAVTSQFASSKDERRFLNHFVVNKNFPMRCTRLKFIPVVAMLIPSIASAQERYYEWHWQMHPMWWWGWGLGMMAIMFFFWVLVIIGFIIGIRWLLGRGRAGKSDPAMQILRERYARGEINKEEFESRKRDLSM